MKCQSCGTDTPYRDVCPDCQRVQDLREHADLRASIHEDFQRKLAQEQLANQRKLLEEQAQGADFREANRVLLDLEMQAVDDLEVAKKKAVLFFKSSLYSANASRLMRAICESSFLLELCAEHELDSLNRSRGFDSEIDYYLDLHTRHNRRLYDKILELVETEDIATRLRPELVRAIKALDDARKAEAQREEDEKRRVQEEFEEAFRQVLAFSTAPWGEPKPDVGREQPQPWYAPLLAILPAQRAAKLKIEEAKSQRDCLIGSLTRATERAVRMHSQDPENASFDKTRFVLAELWCNESFDQRLVIRVIGNLVRNQWLDTRTSVTQTVDAFQQGS